MKTILVLTDFSIRANHAAHYALKLAQKIKADLLLCNIFLDPVHKPKAGQIARPEGDYKTFKKNSNFDLRELADRLNRQLNKDAIEDAYRPLIEHCSKAGAVADIIHEITSNRHVLMAVIGMHDDDGLSTFLLGDHASEIIEKASCPVLVVPYQVPFNGLKKIAFATDLTDSSIEVLRCLSGLAKHSESEILITYVADKKSTDQEEQLIVKNFFNLVSSKINYPKIYYSPIKNKSVIHGLNWVSEHTDIDILVLVHRKRNFFQKIFEESVTQKLADHLTKPMLVFPSSKILETLPVF